MQEEWGAGAAGSRQQQGAQQGNPLAELKAAGWKMRGMAHVVARRKEKQKGEKKDKRTKPHKHKQHMHTLVPYFPPSFPKESRCSYDSYEK